MVFKIDRYLQATKEGAVVQALQLAAESDRIRNKDEKLLGHRLNARSWWGVVATLWRFSPRTAWALKIGALVIVMGMLLFSN